MLIHHRVRSREACCSLYSSIQGYEFKSSSYFIYKNKVVSKGTYVAMKAQCRNLIMMVKLEPRGVVSPSFGELKANLTVKI